MYRAVTPACVAFDGRGKLRDCVYARTPDSDSGAIRIPLNSEFEVTSYHNSANTVIALHTDMLSKRIKVYLSFFFYCYSYFKRMLLHVLTLLVLIC
jgi:hypothetical protein